MRGSTLVLLLALVVPTSSAAQLPEPGARVRATYQQLQPGTGPYRSSTVRGSYRGLVLDTVVILPEREPEPLRIPVARLRRLSVSRGHGGLAIPGAIIGGIASGLTAMVLSIGYCEGSGPCYYRIGGAAGLAGALVGGLLGSQIRYEAWRRVDLAAVRDSVAR